LNNTTSEFGIPQAKVDFSRFEFAPVVRYEGSWFVFDLTDRYDPEFIEDKVYGIGRYNEKRKHMYVAEQFEGRRNIHMGIDIWTPAAEPVYAFYKGEIAYFTDHDQPGNYGPTIVTRHDFDGKALFALHGHLSRASLEGLEVGEHFETGGKIAEIGDKIVNGGWSPHLHFQISFEDPGKADMPGVVAEEEREKAVRRYPDPRLVLGELYRGANPLR